MGSIRQQMGYQAECSEVGMSTGVQSGVCLCTYQMYWCMLLSPRLFCLRLVALFKWNIKQENGILLKPINRVPMLHILWGYDRLINTLLFSRFVIIFLFCFHVSWGWFRIEYSLFIHVILIHSPILLDSLSYTLFLDYPSVFYVKIILLQCSAEIDCGKSILKKSPWKLTWS